MKVFLDANVLVSGFTARGLCADVIRLVLADHELITGEVILVEIERVLSKKIGLPASNVEEILSFLEDQTVQPKPKTVVGDLVRDEDDAMGSRLGDGCQSRRAGDRRQRSIGCGRSRLGFDDNRSARLLESGQETVEDMSCGLTGESGTAVAAVARVVYIHYCVFLGRTKSHWQL